MVARRAEGQGPGVNLLAVGLSSELTHVIQAEPSRIDDNVAVLRSM
jgi:hypothetical protein